MIELRTLLRTYTLCTCRCISQNVLLLITDTRLLSICLFCDYRHAGLLLPVILCELLFVVDVMFVCMFMYVLSQCLTVLSKVMMLEII